MRKNAPTINGRRRDTGLYMLITRGSTYLVDVDAGTVTRYPGTGTEPDRPPRPHRDDCREVPFTSVSITMWTPLRFTVVRDGGPEELVTSELRAFRDLSRGRS